jgi:hypothetical protein
VRPPVSPLPAIAAGKGPFRVTGVSSDSSGFCALPSNGKPGLFNVPLETDSIQALAIRMYELGHLGLARIGAVPNDMLSKLYRARLHIGWVQFALDVIVNAFMIARGNREIAHLELWTGVLPAKIPRWVAAMQFLRSEGLSREMQMRMSLQARAQFSPDELNLLCSTARLLRSQGAQASLISVEELRKLLRRLQKTFGPDSTKARDPLLELAGIVVRESSSRRTRDPSGGRHRSATSEQNEWGRMALMNPPLSLRCTGRRGKVAKKLIASYCGAFRFPHRALIPAADGRAFGLKRRVHGGTILIDCSGSMNLTTDRLTSLVLRAPGATVALYAGLPGAESGLLMVIATNGHFAEIEEATSRFGGGNIIDGPALRWLSRQAAPRLWVSDGCVTGRGDKPGINLNSETDSIIRTAGIRRLESLERC